MVSASPGREAVGKATVVGKAVVGKAERPQWKAGRRPVTYSSARGGGVGVGERARGTAPWAARRVRGGGKLAGGRGKDAAKGHQHSAHCETLRKTMIFGVMIAQRNNLRFRVETRETGFKPCRRRGRAVVT